MIDTLQTHRQVLQRTPATLDALLRDQADCWTHGNDGEDTWSPFDVLGHLVHGEHADWIPRVQCLLEHGENQAFHPFDRVAMFRESEGKSVNQLLDEFAAARQKSLEDLDALRLTEDDLERTGRHPEFGSVRLGQLLATWVAHDLTHISQISRVMARQYRQDAGPWKQYIRILQD